MSCSRLQQYLASALTQVEGIRLTFSWCARDDLCHFSLRWVLAKCAEEIAQCLTRNSASAFLVEEGEGLLVLC